MFVQAPEFVVNIIKLFWSPGMKILEIGCGPAFLRKVFGIDYIGVDIVDTPYAPELLRDVDFICPADKLVLRDESVDIVVIKSAFFLFPDHFAALQEALRVLKSSGKLLIFDYNKKTQKDLQMREGHTRYPCWTQWGLKKLVQSNGFIGTTLLVSDSPQATGFRKFYRLIAQELKGTWVIVAGGKK